MGPKITEPIDGAILNRHDGKETEDGLSIMVRGICAGNAPVTVNGMAADVTGDKFCAEVCLNSVENALTVKSAEQSDSITVLYDRNSFKRYRFSLDDNWLFLRDIAEKEPASIFENNYMALWKHLHDNYGIKVNCNIYYEVDDFNLTMFPDRYRGEWQDNADWFRLTFHALNHQPKNPYIDSTYERMATDYERVVNEIMRFAGEEVMNTFTTVHWGEATVEACRALRDRGIVGLCGYFRFKDDKPWVSYYLDSEHTEYMATHDYWKDVKEDIIFIHHAIVINNVAIDKIVPHFEGAVANPHQGEVLELMIHEPQFYPTRKSYTADYVERCETAVRWVTDNGYEPVFYSNGFIGSGEDIS